MLDLRRYPPYYQKIRQGSPDESWKASSTTVAPEPPPYMHMPRRYKNESSIASVVAALATVIAFSGVAVAQSDTALDQARKLLSSRDAGAAYALLEPGEGGLPEQSVVVVAQISSVEKTRLGARIGALSAARVDEILAGLRFQQRSFFTSQS